MILRVLNIRGKYSFCTQIDGYVLSSLSKTLYRGLYFFIRLFFVLSFYLFYISKGGILYA